MYFTLQSRTHASSSSTKEDETTDTLTRARFFASSKAKRQRLESGVKGLF